MKLLPIGLRARSRFAASTPPLYYDAVMPWVDPILDGPAVAGKKNRMQTQDNSMARSKWCLTVLGRVAWLVCMLPGCTMARYLPQAAWGQLDILARAQPIERVLPQAPERLAKLLRQVPDIKAFASRHGLTISDNYDSYTELGREAAVWVVTASGPLALDADTWWFPGFGSFPYLGWFDPRDAARFADQLAQDGRDVYVRRVSAYSTLGWFRDPILSTMLTRGRSVTGDFVNTVLHESVHATVYVDGQGTFNESLALFVADRLTPEYLAFFLGAGSAESQAYLAAEERRKAEAAELLRAYAELADLYASPLTPLEKLVRKQQLLLALEARLETDLELNNATLTSYRTYRAGQEQLAELFAQCQHQWPRFLAAVSRVNASFFAKQQEEDLEPVLSTLLARGCPDPT